MARTAFILPKMGESITEATILKWLKEVGDTIEEDEVLVEIATDKVDSELPSPFEGTIVEILFNVGDVVDVGKPIAILETEYAETVSDSDNSNEMESKSNDQSTPTSSAADIEKSLRPSSTNRFFSPLIRNIAEIEKLTIAELDMIQGSGAEGRLTKSDIEKYIHQKNQPVGRDTLNYKSAKVQEPTTAYRGSYSGETEIVEMDRMRKMIADHMVYSKQTAPHVTSFLEIDVTEIVEWRSAVKASFKEKYNQNITYTPIFINAVGRAIKDFPGINASVDGHQIIYKKDINVGMATATDSGNLIVPVIKNADQLSLVELAQSVNDLAIRARSGKLMPDEVQGGTFTLTNVGTFGNTMGTPIINQPQVAIMSTGAIRKKPAVIESSEGDKIGIRKFMFLSLSYDHRIVDGALGGQFLRRVGDYLEGFRGEEISG